MRSIVCLVLLAGCLRARATVVHPTNLERSHNSSGADPVIARQAPHAVEVSQPQPDDGGTNLASIELGAVIPFDDTRVHLAPGVRIFNANSVLWGIAVGADFGPNRHRPSFALEGSLYAGDGPVASNTVQTTVDLFAGVAIASRRSAISSIAIGPSIGVLGMPGGHTVVTVGLGLRAISRPRP
jgi:hypothetical protein